MESWYSEHRIILDFLIAIMTLVLGNYGYTWLCYLLLGKRIDSLRLNEVPHLLHRIHNIEETLHITPPED